VALTGDLPMNKLSFKEVRKQSLKKLDAWWNVIVLDHAITPIVYLVYNRIPWLTPNMITTVSLAVGGAAAVAFYYHFYWWAVLLYQFSFILDCVDGRVARLRQVSSPFGAFYDGLVNHIVYLANVVGLGYGLGLDWHVVVPVSCLLVARALGNFLNECMPERPTETSWSHFVPNSGGFLDRHRLLPPGSFPDKHAFMFGLCPLAGVPIFGMWMIVAADVLLLMLKMRKFLADYQQPANAE
jgi:hypothetical protein